ncbi:MAG: phosphotransferase [Proteobacteria bacterium]|nr:phosphotransferase [Pseudomonadota bacterium]
MSDLFPTRPTDLTSTWLSEALGFEVSDFTISYFTEGTSVMGQVTRLYLTSKNGPASLIAKFATPVSANRGVAEAYDMYGREIGFYRGINRNVRLRTPQCCFAGYNPTNHDFLLILEDMVDYTIGDQVAGCTIEEARRVVDMLAAFHASAWDDQAPDVVSHNNPLQVQGMVGGFQMGWPVVQKEFNHLIPLSARHIGDLMPAAIPALLQQMCQPPVCLTHADVRLDNIFFGATDVSLVDWQSVCTSAPEHDLAYFITQSVPQEVRRSEDLLTRYHTGLTGHGIVYDPAVLSKRYRVCALYLLCYAVVIAGTLDMGNERGRQLARTLLGNSLSALDELNAFELL